MILYFNSPLFRRRQWLYWPAKGVCKPWARFTALLHEESLKSKLQKFELEISVFLSYLKIRCDFPLYFRHELLMLFEGLSVHAHRTGIYFANKIGIFLLSYSRQFSWKKSYKIYQIVSSWCMRLLGGNDLQQPRPQAFSLLEKGKGSGNEFGSIIMLTIASGFWYFLSHST